MSARFIPHSLGNGIWQVRDAATGQDIGDAGSWSFALGLAWGLNNPPASTCGCPVETYRWALARIFRYSPDEYAGSIATDALSKTGS